MRLTGWLREEAKQDLLERLVRGPRTTGELVGTMRFHGARTLTWRQIRTLLRESGEVREQTVGFGMRTTTIWALKETEHHERNPERRDGNRDAVDQGDERERQELL